jgi:hypothetical protein
MTGKPPDKLLKLLDEMETRVALDLDYLRASVDRGGLTKKEIAHLKNDERVLVRVLNVLRDMSTDVIVTRSLSDALNGA